MQKAYLDIKHGSTGTWIDVVTAQDYHEGGPHAHSHRTGTHESGNDATLAGTSWANTHGYTIVKGPEQF